MVLIPPANRPRPAWLARCLVALGAAALVMTVTPTGPAVAATTTWVVRPGESIQAAVDGLGPATPIKIAAGRYGRPSAYRVRD